MGLCGGVLCQRLRRCIASLSGSVWCDRRKNLALPRSPADRGRKRRIEHRGTLRIGSHLSNTVGFRLDTTDSHSLANSESVNCRKFATQPSTIQFGQLKTLQQSPQYSRGHVMVRTQQMTSQSTSRLSCAELSASVLPRRYCMDHQNLIIRGWT